MAFMDIWRHTLPIQVRQDLGLKLLNASSQHYATMNFYFTLLTGKKPQNIKLLPHNEAEVSYNGWKLLCPRDGILAFVEVLQDRIYEVEYEPKEGDIVLDIGAYVGPFTARASSLVGKIGKVIALEPDVTNICYLEKNTRFMENVAAYRYAITNHNGTERLFHSEASPCHTIAYAHEKSVPVPAITVDKLVSDLKLPRVDFIKIDAEGAEMKILQGATKTLEAFPRLAIAAYHETPEGLPEAPIVEAYLMSMGFKVIIKKKYIYAEKKT